MLNVNHFAVDPRPHESRLADLRQYLAMLAAGRIAERRLQALCERFGRARIQAFIEAWFDYTEKRARRAIGALPAGRLGVETRLDPYPGLDEGLTLRATLEIDPAAGRVRADLRDNPDCVPVGLNLTEATSLNAVVAATLMVLKSGAHSMREVEHSVKRLQQAGVNLRGLLFNDISLESQRYGAGKYSYQYAYK